MKTIRENCYETNSSSTHSVSIVNKSKLDAKRDKKELVIDNVLYPNNLTSTNAYIETSMGDGHIIQCRTKYEKGAMMVLHLREMTSSGDVDELIFDQVVTKLKIALDLKDIDTSFECGAAYYSEDDYEPQYLDGLKQSDALFASGKIDTIITDIVLNEDAVIVDEESPY